MKKRSFLCACLLAAALLLSACAAALPAETPDDTPGTVTENQQQINAGKDGNVQSNDTADADANAPQPGEADASAPQTGDADASAPQAGDAHASAPQPGGADASTPQPDNTDASAPQPGDAHASAPQPGDAHASAPQPDNTDASAPQAGDADASAPQPGDADASAPQAPQKESDERLPIYGNYYYDLTNVVLYLEVYGELPPNYIMKNDAQALGWKGGSVEEYQEGAAIGGSFFGNYEGLLPNDNGQRYTECDIDTNDYPSRGSRRLVFSDDGRYFYTSDHYKSFTEYQVTADYEVVPCE